MKGATSLVSLGTVDVLIIAVYFVLFLIIGFYLKRYTKTGNDFFMAGRGMTSWIAGLSTVAANLGAPSSWAVRLRPINTASRRPLGIPPGTPQEIMEILILRSPE